MSAPRLPVPPGGSAPAARAPYRRGGPAELFRLAARALDFVFLVARASRAGALPPLASLGRCVLLELGPGPTKLRLLKRLMFGRVRYLDSDPYGPAAADVTLMDLEELRSVSSWSEVLGVESAGPLVLFADHCLEHLSRDTVDHVLAMAREVRAACLLRVPNVRSPVGRLHYAGDPTHRTPFDEGHRRSLVALGFTVTPHTRWYRPDSGASAARMDVAEEVVIAVAPARPSSPTSARRG